MILLEDQRRQPAKHQWWGCLLLFVHFGLGYQPVLVIFQKQGGVNNCGLKHSQTIIQIRVRLGSRRNIGEILRRGRCAGLWLGLPHWVRIRLFQHERRQRTKGFLVVAHRERVYHNWWEQGRRWGGVGCVENWYMSMSQTENMCIDRTVKMRGALKKMGRKKQQRALDFN